MENRLGEKLYAARRAKGLSQEELAEAVGVSRQTVSQWENDKFQPSSSNIDVLCRIFDLPREQLLGESFGANGGSEQRGRGNSSSGRQRGFLILIAVISATAVIMAMITVLMSFICLTSNTGDMMDNSYSIPQYVFYVLLAVTVILILADVGVVILKKRDKNRRS